MHQLSEPLSELTDCSTLVDDAKKKKKKMEFIFWNKIIIHFVNV
jgi:hypothetical protein